MGLAPSYHVTYPALGRGLPAKSRCFEFFRCCIYVGDPSAPLYKHAALYSAIKLSSSYGAAAHRLCLGPSRAAAIFFFLVPVTGAWGPYLVAAGGYFITTCNSKAIQTRMITGRRLMLAISFYARWLACF